MRFLKTIIFFWILLHSYAGGARQSLDLEKLTKAYKKIQDLSPAQAYILEIKLAEAWMKQVQLGKNKKKGIKQALFFYRQSLHRVQDVSEQAKIWFRIGYLYEMNRSPSEALQAYHQVVALRPSELQLQKARRLIEKLKDKANFKKSRTDSLAVEFQKSLDQTARYIKQRQMKKALSVFKKACSLYEAAGESSIGGSFAVQTAHLLTRMHRSRSLRKWLMSFYQAYLSYFPQDSSMVVSAAEWAGRVKQHKVALDIYEKYILLEKSAGGASQQSQDVEDMFQMYFSSAEMSRDPQLLLRACDFYLEHSRLKTFYSKVLFSRYTSLFYLRQYNEVAPAFRLLALSTSSPPVLRKKSTIYALKALLKSGQELTAHKWAGEFAFLFPKEKPVYKGLVRFPFLSSSKVTYNGIPVTPASTPELTKNWEILKWLSMEELPPRMKPKYCHYFVHAAVELHHFHSLEKVFQKCLSHPEISDSDKKQLLYKKAQVAEFVYDFASAYGDLQKISSSGSFHLCLLSILSFAKNKPECREYIKSNPADKHSIFFIENLIRQSKDPKRMLVQYMPAVSRKKEMFSRLYLDTGVWKNSARAVNLHSSTEAFHFKQKKEKLEQLFQQQKQLRDHLGSVKNSADRVQHSILLSRFKKQVFVGYQDWTYQVVSLNILLVENLKFIEKLAQVTDVKAEETEVESLKSSLQVENKNIQKKLNRLWSLNDDQTIFRHLKKDRKVSISALSWELALLLKVSAPRHKQQLVRRFRSIDFFRNHQQVSWRSLQSNPLHLEALQSAVQKKSYGIIPIYLKTRLKNFKDSQRVSFPLSF